MDKPLVFLGAGGHARVLLEIARVTGRRVHGWVVPDISAGVEVSGYPVLGNDETLVDKLADEFDLVNAVGSTSSLIRRREVFEKFSKRGFGFPHLIHPSAVIAAGVRMEEGIQIMAGVVLQPGVHIGRNTIVNTRSSIDHDGEIGDHVHIAPGVTISGGVTIQEGVHVGAGATIIQGLTIGSWSLVGAGSLVIRSVGERQMVTGAPARVAKTLRDWKRVLVSPEASIRMVIETIDREAFRIALVVDEKSVLLGTVTDGDIRRAVLANVPLSKKIASIMNKDPVVANEKESREKVISLMKERNLYQIPILDRQGRVIGLELLENSMVGC